MADERTDERKRIIEQTASTEIFDDDWFIKDSALHNTTKISQTVLKQEILKDVKGVVELTQAEYDALPSSKLTDGILYAIKDSEDIIGNIENAINTLSGDIDDLETDLETLDGRVDEIASQIPTTAEDLTYDNTTSELESDNVQDALDEVVGLIAEAGQIDDVQVKTTGDYESVVDENKVAKIDLSNMLIEKSVPNLPQPVASFSDGADAPLKELNVAITPQQDLHGYDAPWAGGAGKNKFDQDTAYASYKQSDGGFRITGNTATVIYNAIPQRFVNTEITVSVYIDCSKEASPNGVRIACHVNGAERESSRVEAGEKKKVSLTFTPTSTDDYWYLTYGNTGANYFYFKECQLEIGSTATSYAPYENICPISGWDNAIVSNRANANIWDEQTRLGYYDTTGNYVSAQSNVCNKNLIVLPHDHNIRFISGSGYIGRLCWYDCNKNFISSFVPTSTATTSFIPTIPENACYLNFDMKGGYGTTYNNDISINYPSTDTEYHAYGGTTYTIPFTDSQGNPVEVYGGTLDVTSGVLTVTHKIHKWSSGFSPSSSSTEDKHLFVASRPSDFAQTSADNWSKKYRSNILSLTSRGISSTNMVDGSIYAGTSYLTIRLDSVANTQSAIDELLASTELEIVAPLVIPITIQLNPTAVKSIEGVNNIFADTGDVTKLEYIANATDVIANLEARVTALENA